MGKVLRCRICYHSPIYKTVMKLHQLLITAPAHKLTTACKYIHIKAASPRKLKKERTVIKTKETLPVLHIEKLSKHISHLTCFGVHIFCKGFFFFFFIFLSLATCVDFFKKNGIHRQS